LLPSVAAAAALSAAAHFACVSKAILQGRALAKMVPPWPCWPAVRAGEKMRTCSSSRLQSQGEAKHVPVEHVACAVTGSKALAETGYQGCNSRLLQCREGIQRPVLQNIKTLYCVAAAAAGLLLLACPCANGVPAPDLLLHKKQLLCSAAAVLLNMRMLYAADYDEGRD
jgi:hypothetical protein